MRRVCGLFAVMALALLLDRPRGTEGILKNCYVCRSRGDLGTCKDPFPRDLNATQASKLKGVEIVPCASGWCSKIIESQNLNNEYGVATERLCLQRGVDDNEERCAFTKYNNKIIYMCFCNGDLCNSATRSAMLPTLYLAAVVAALARWLH
ncbi:uncharacterized protein LOC100118576 [Nasonia vitripennis]|uniref:Protein sleepless n=1 Tax=Nasonia vitripennis TaxID=7425 RepID=A0A7M7LJK6_NASVI|nr:uncharacterized protein LOC100118576 [Nasonia vitripennis]